MSNHNGNANKMVSDTPRTDDAQWGHHKVTTKFARQLERELNAANSKIKRLQEAGDAVVKTLFCGCPHGDSVFHCQTCVSAWDAWEEAKEAKP